MSKPLRANARHFGKIVTKYCDFLLIFICFIYCQYYRINSAQVTKNLSWQTDCTVRCGRSMRRYWIRFPKGPIREMNFFNLVLFLIFLNLVLAVPGSAPE